MTLICKNVDLTADQLHCLRSVAAATEGGTEISSKGGEQPGDGKHLSSCNMSTNLKPHKYTLTNQITYALLA